MTIWTWVFLYLIWIVLSHLRHSFYVVTALRKIRLYDTKQSKPVIDFQFEKDKFPFNNVVLNHDGTYLYVADNAGSIYMLDNRKNFEITGKLKGAMGSITHLAISTSHPYLASVSLDRYLRVYNTNNNKLYRKFYLKNKLTSVAIYEDNFDVDKAEEVDLAAEEPKEVKTQNEVKKMATKMTKKSKKAKLKLTFQRKKVTTDSTE